MNNRYRYVIANQSLPHFIPIDSNLIEGEYFNSRFYHAEMMRILLLSIFQLVS